MISGMICVLMMAGFSLRGFSQCQPDTANCVDVGDPGQICPEKLPFGVVGEIYRHNITILAPESGNVGQLNINLNKIRLESIENLPVGIVFKSETREFYPNEAYCVSLEGIPVKEGIYNLKVSVTPYIRLLGIPFAMPVQYDSTSVSLTVEASSGINSITGEDFSLINAYPNPFNSSTRIGFLDLNPDEAELRVYNMLGRQVYFEHKTPSFGENYFDFNGQELSSGYYIYFIVKENRQLRGKIIKNLP